MGQYFKFVNIDKREQPDTRIGSAKLTEHSYLGNECSGETLLLLNQEWKGDRVIQIGDYADNNSTTNYLPFLEEYEKKYNINSTSSVKSIYSYADTFIKIKSKKREKIKYAYNLDKKEYLDLERQPVQWFTIRDEKIKPLKFDALALLIAVGNGLGLGDYYAVNHNKVGLWAGDHIETSPTLLKEYSDYKENTYIFNERLSLNSNVQKFEDISLENIIQQEEEVLKEFIDEYKRDYDLSNLEFETTYLTSEEQEALTKVFKEYTKN